MTRSSAWRAVGSVLAAFLVLGPRPAGAADAAPQLWIAKTQSIATQVTAFAEVEPQMLLRLRAGIAGTLGDVTVRPGDTVAAGAVLGHLAGPSVDALLASRRARLAGAEATLTAAQQELASERAKRAERLSTRAAVARATGALSNAEADRDTARAALSAAQDMTTLRAPAAGRVLTLDAAAGERVAADDTILTLLPANQLWLRAAFYGSDAARLRADMAGRFTPAGGGAAVAVKVRTIVGAVRPDGAHVVNLVATKDAPPWFKGERGTVSVDGGTVTGVIVPTPALILDKAEWWILVHTKSGDEPRKVTPGPASGGLTLVENGLAPGTAVVVANAYLQFHRGISSLYQPPD